MKTYRSGHNGIDSKFIGLVSVLSTKNPVFMRGHAVRKNKYFAVLSVSSFQKFFLCKKHQENGGLTYTEAYRSGHNGPDSKSGSLHGLVGSNPTASAIEKSSNHAVFWIFLFMPTPKIIRFSTVLSIVLERTAFLFIPCIFSLLSPTYCRNPQSQATPFR